MKLEYAPTRQRLRRIQPRGGRTYWPLLMLYRDSRLAIDARIPKLPQDDRREPESLSGQQFAAMLFRDTNRALRFTAHNVLLTEIGLPNALRIISRVQPAQHLYLRGSATEIARLSPALSLPCAAQAGHRVQ